MLRIEIDIFSGRPNPVWIVQDEQAVKQLLERIGEEPTLIAKPGSGFSGLGFREVIVEALSDDVGQRRVPSRFALASIASANFRASAELAQKLIESMPLRSRIKLLENEVTPLDAKIRDYALEALAGYLRSPPKPWPPRPRPTSNPLIDTTADAKCTNCNYEISQFNPGFWNNPATQPYNNCYNYGRNWKTNTFAQPGRAHGAQATTMSCAAVSAAAMADGLKRRCDPCLPQSEFPRRLVALMVAPGYDYHWMRHQRGGFWGHKPGQTAARNVDNNNAIIADPQTCNRGPYTDFCGYFYAGKSVVIN